MPATLKAINNELARLGTATRLAKAGGYFYFRFGEAVDWLDRTVRVVKVSDLSIQEWLAEYGRLKRLNKEIMGVGKTGKGPAEYSSGSKVVPAGKRHSKGG